MKQSSTDVDTSEVDLIERLTSEEVETIKYAINLPERLFEALKEPVDFILNVNLWQYFDPEMFFMALQLVRPDLVRYAENIPYLNECSPQTGSETMPEISRLVHILRNEISVFHWKIILKEYNYDVKGGFDISKILNFCLTQQIITKDLEEFKQSLRKVKKLNLVEKLEALQNKLSILDDHKFVEIFKSEAFEKDFLI